MQRKILVPLAGSGLRDQDIAEIITLLKHDKKNEFGKVKFALLDGIGKIKIYQQVDNDMIKASFEDYKNTSFI